MIPDFHPPLDACVVVAPDGYDCWRERVQRFAQRWLDNPMSELVFKRGRAVAVRCAIRRSVLRGARNIAVIELCVTREGQPAVAGCFPLCRHMIERIAGPELKWAAGQRTGH